VGVTAYQLLAGRFPWHNDSDYQDEVHDSKDLGVAISNKVLWRAIMYAEFDYDWPPWDVISGGLVGSGVWEVGGG
jgi:hypothetical protein